MCVVFLYSSLIILIFLLAFIKNVALQQMKNYYSQ